MFLLLNKKLRFITADPKDVFIKRILDHTEYSMKTNFFTATTEDYAIRSYSRDGTIIIKSRFMRQSFRIIVKVTSECPTQISVRLVPSIFSLAPHLVIVFFLLIMPFPNYFKAISIGITYLFLLVGYAFEIWWTNNLFNHKLVRKN